MKMCDDFELVDVADEYMAIPVGEKADSVKGMFVLNDAAAFLLENMRENKSKEELVSLLIKYYDVDREKASADITEMLDEMKATGLICD